MLSFLYVYSDHSILECYNLFSGVELSMRSFCVIIVISYLFIKAWRNWPTLEAKQYCFGLESGITFLSIANDSETNNSVSQAMLSSFAKASVLKLCVIW